jgi:hypothetical protein
MGHSHLPTKYRTKFDQYKNLMQIRTCLIYPTPYPLYASIRGVFKK